ncbi:MAG TPA: hypothetical protein VFG71_07075 [Nitrospiraceae bacterium]|nr:hypothetical protein [Nitrospiraceae bacterium]
MPADNKLKIFNRTVMIMALGASMFGVASVRAEYRGDIPTGDMTNTERSQFRNTDLSGGFYDDRFKADDWFYDFYENPGTTDRSIPGSTISPAERARVADAAHPWESDRVTSREEQEAAFQRYYDEPWFYDQRDPVYTMPMTRVRDDSFRTARDSGESATGIVQAVKQLRHRTSGGQNTVVLLQTADGRRLISDLGPARETLDMGISQGVLVNIRGHREDIGPYSVLMADEISSGARRVLLNRNHEGTWTDSRQVEGRIERFRDVPVRQTGQMHRTAAVRTPDGRFALVDFGPSTAESLPANAAPEDRIVAAGPVVQIGNYPVMFANRVSVNDGIPVRIARPDGSYVQPARRPFEASQLEAANPSCIGGGCESAVVNRSQPRDAHSNAMDGTIRSERPERR